jgi:hypothetical protein
MITPELNTVIEYVCAAGSIVGAAIVVILLTSAYLALKGK